MITKVVGVTFSNEDGSSRARIIANMSESDKIYLERDPFNQYDSNAVKVCVVKNGEKKQIGFLAKDIAAAISPKLRKGICFNIRIMGCGTWNDRPFCEIEIEELESSSHQNISKPIGSGIPPKPIAPSIPKPVEPVKPKPVESVVPEKSPSNSAPTQRTEPKNHDVSWNTTSHTTHKPTINGNSSQKFGCMGVVLFAGIVTIVIALL